MKSIKKICPACGRKVFLIIENPELITLGKKFKVYIITPHNDTANEFCINSNRKIYDAS